MSPQIEQPAPDPMQNGAQQPSDNLPPDAPHNEAHQQGQQDRQTVANQDSGSNDTLPANDAAKRAEVKAFKAWLKKRPQADIHTFKAEYLTHDELHEIADDVREVAVKGNRFTPRGDDEPSPPLPIELNITDDDVDFALRKWDSLFPDFAGLLDAEVT